MPFTLAHPIATAPLWYASLRRLDLSALVIGSMIPDLPYYLNLRMVSTLHPTVTDITFRALPAALAVTFLWKGFVRAPVLHLLTGRRHSEQSMRAILVRVPWLLFAILLGAGTHWLWDAASHPNGWFVQRWDWLNHEVLGLPLLKWNQYGSGVVGTLAVVLWWRLERKKARNDCPVAQLSPRVRRLAWALAALSVGGLVAAANLMHGGTPHSVHRILLQSSIGFVAGLAIWSVIYATNYRLSGANRHLAKTEG